MPHDSFGAVPYASAMTPWFNIRKAAQVAAYFAIAEGGSINVLKLTKLIYLADRGAMERYGFPILNDQLVSMNHGPVDSMTLDCINGVESENPAWSSFIGGRAGYQVGAAAGVSPDNLDELSRAEMDILRATWGQFGHMDKYAIRDYTHAHCPEWEDPNGSSSPIPYDRVFKYLQKEDPIRLRDLVQEEKEIDEFFAAL